MRKFWFVMLAVFMAASALTGCTRRNNAEPAATSEPYPVHTIVVDLNDKEPEPTEMPEPYFDSLTGG